MQQILNAIKTKYGVSDQVSSQVLSALTEIEKHRQIAAGGQVAGMPSLNQGAQVPNINSIVGGLLNNGNPSQSGGLLDIIKSLIALVMSVLGGNQTQGGNNANNANNVMSILNDLTGGATHPGQAPDLTNILGNLLGNSTTSSTAGSDNQLANLEGMVNTLLAGQTQLRGGQSSQMPK